MLKATRTHLLLLSIFTFGFLYRMLLMLWDGFPPGADIGLHNSVIYSITGSGNTDFLYNFFHIGGGVSLTFPGYHIFTAAVLMLTGLPEYFAHAALVSLFSSLTVLCAFLITRRVWSTPTAYIVAFLAAISRFDIEMLLWAGYPNVITLMLIPLTFYLYIQKERFSKAPFLVSTSLLVGSLFLTHSLSAAMFVGITVATVFFVLVWPKTLGASRKTALYWFLPIVFGAALVLPFLMQAIPTYLSEYGSIEIAQATLSARVLPLEIVLPLFGVIVAFFVFSKKFYRTFFALPVFLLVMWVFVPLILTQGYLVGLPIDYNRFMYFLILPVLIFMAVLIEYGSDFFATVIDTYRTFTQQTQTNQQTVQKRLARFSVRISEFLTRKRIYSIFVLFFLLFSFVALPIFMTPSMKIGESIQSFYQTMTQPGWAAIQWAKQNTPADSVFVSDALYGWWFGGFAQRPTLSAVDPQYLTVNREVDNATFARTLLDTDYMIDNGYIQVRDDGGYLSRHNPEILVDQNWTYYPYSFFTFDSNDIGITYNINGANQYVTVDDLAVKDMRMENYSDHETISITQSNGFFNYTRLTTVYGGSRFVNLTSTFESTAPGVSFVSAKQIIQTTGKQIPYNDKLTVGLVEVGTKAFGQLIFNTPPAETTIRTESQTSDTVKAVELLYLFNGSHAEIKMSATAYSASNYPQYYTDPIERNRFFSQRLTENLNFEETLTDLAFVNFDYRSQIQSRGISYIVCRDAAIQPKFADDPLFNLVFINKEAAIFKINGNLDQG